MSLINHLIEEYDRYTKIHNEEPGRLFMSLQAFDIFTKEAREISNYVIGKDAKDWKFLGVPVYPTEYLLNPSFMFGAVEKNQLLFSLRKKL